MQTRWRAEEDEVLRAHVEQYTELGYATDWSRVAEKLPRWSNKDCRKRWVNNVCGSLRKGPWEANEDMRLRNAVGKHGQKWTLVAGEVGSRSADQCAKRWQHNLDPRLDHQRWTPKEEELLLESVDRYGREWRKIQEKHFSTRSPNDLKNRLVETSFTILSKRTRSKKSSKSGPGPGHNHSSPPSPFAVCERNQENTSLDTSMGTDSGTTSRLDSSRSSVDIGDSIYNTKNLQLDMSEVIQPTTNMQPHWDQPMQPHGQPMSLLPQTQDSQAMNIDDLDANSSFPWTACTTSPSAAGSRPFSSGDFSNSMVFDGFDTMSHNSFPHNQLTTCNSNSLGNGSSHVGNNNMAGFVLTPDRIDTFSGGAQHRHSLPLPAHRLSRLENCQPGGNISLQAEGCDREVLNYLLDILHPIRHLVKIKIDM